MSLNELLWHRLHSDIENELRHMTYTFKDFWCSWASKKFSHGNKQKKNWLFNVFKQSFQHEVVGRKSL